MRRVDLSVYATAVVTVSSFLPWIDARFLSTGCDNHGALTVVAILGWLAGAVLLVAALVLARGEGKTWRDLMLLPCVVASLVGFILVYGATNDCSGGFIG